jgi:hypothetical protein
VLGSAVRRCSAALQHAGPPEPAAAPTGVPKKANLESPPLGDPLTRSMPCSGVFRPSLSQTGTIVRLSHSWEPAPNSSMISRGRVRARWARMSGRVTACRFHDLLVGDSYMAGGTVGLRDAGHESFLPMRRALSAIGKNAMTSVCVEARAL